MGQHKRYRSVYTIATMTKSYYSCKLKYLLFLSFYVLSTNGSQNYDDRISYNSLENRVVINVQNVEPNEVEDINLILNENNNTIETPDNHIIHQSDILGEFKNDYTGEGIE